MTHFICDRCGKERNSNGSYELTVNPRNGQRLFSYDYENFLEDIDLCEDCFSELKEWIKGTNE